MHYQVYVPGAADVAFELTKVGLADHVPNAEVLTTPTGPDGQGGAIFSWQTNGKPKRMHFSEKESDWTPAPDKRYWVGLWKDDPLAPADIVIGDDAGAEMRLGDGNTWLMPAIGAADKEVIVDPDGRRTFALPKRYEYLRGQQLRWASWIRQQQHFFKVTEREYLDWFDLAVAALKLNYRLTPEVAAAARLFSMRNIVRAVNVICGDLFEQKGGE